MAVGVAAGPEKPVCKTVNPRATEGRATTRTTRRNDVVTMPAMRRDTGNTSDQATAGTCVTDLGLSAGN